MGKPGKNQNAPSVSDQKTAVEPYKKPSSEARKKGRLLRLHFTGPDVPIILHQIEFRLDRDHGMAFRKQRDPVYSFQWREAPKALSLIFLEYVLWDKQGRKGEFFFDGPDRQELAGTLGDGKYKPDSNIFGVFCVRRGKDIDNHALNIFPGQNTAGRAEDNREQRISINPDFLPPDCIEIYWNAKGDDSLTNPKTLNELAILFRKSLEIPEAPAKPSIGQEPELPLPPTEAKPAVPEPKRSPIKSALELFGFKPKLPPVEPEPIQESPPGKSQAKSSAPDADVTIGGIEVEFKKVHERQKAPEPARSPEPQSLSTLPPPPKIDPRLFQITNTYGHTWDDYEGLLNFGRPDNDADVWRIRDACEGTLIFGAVGSGKTSGSGSAIARAFLQAGFGGLVLTAKPDEARRWVRMCQETGRAGDCVHVTPSSGHRLNILQYETQRPGNRMSVTDDLITLFRCILDVISRDKGGGGSNEEFWTRSTNQIMRKLFDLFLLADEPLALDRLVRFMNLAPQDNDTDWTKIKLFADVINRAKANSDRGSESDQRIFQEVFEYWTQNLPRITEATRSGIVTGFSAMADSLSGRGIYEMVATETNITPEMILSGLVVILDVPLKGNVQGGLMVQAIWKLLFQQAAERRADKGLPTARPAFLWEDEGHMFFSKNDVDFQPTARDIRAPHVIMSQNIHNFMQQGHDTHAMNAVFSAMNTYIFHCNGDLDTNKWASERIGQEKKLKLTSDGLLKTLSHKDITFFDDRPPDEVKNIGGFGLSEETKSFFRPEDFANLKRGGGGTCEAVILWLSHQFAANKYRNFCVSTFDQEPKP